MKLLLTTLTFIYLYFVSTSLFAADTEVPASNQIQILQKMLASEKQLISSNKNEINVGIIYQSDNKLSNISYKSILSYIQSKIIKIGSKTLKIIPINITSSNSRITNILKKYNVDIFIITQLRAVNFNQIRQFAIENSILTYATSANIMEDNNFAMSIGYKGNNLQPIINKKQLITEGYNFPSSILKYARIIE